MTDVQLQDALLSWADKAINDPVTIGSCTFTKGSTTVTGTNFVTNNVVQADGFVKVDSKTFYYQVASVDSETEITLTKAYTNSTETANASYSDIGLNIIHGKENAPKPGVSYMSIHQPINVRKIGRAAQGYSDNSGDTNIISNYEASVTFEVVGLLSDYLRMLLDSIEKQVIKDYLRNLNLSFMRNENILDTSDMTENKWTLRSSVDIFILYPHETTENTSYIGDVEFTNNILT